MLTPQLKNNSIQVIFERIKEKTMITYKNIEKQSVDTINDLFTRLFSEKRPVNFEILFSCDYIGKKEIIGFIIGNKYVCDAHIHFGFHIYGYIKIKCNGTETTYYISHSRKEKTIQFNIQDMGTYKEY
jgi:hypothetical protein